MAGIFKAYDIRGIFGKDLTEEIAVKIGRALVDFLKCRQVIVGQDMRPHSEPLFHALARGLTLQGADVIRVGECSTPMSYFANGHLGADASVMITASHNPGEWNGFKLCREQAIPLSGDTGIMDIERLVVSDGFAPAADRAGAVSTYVILPEYARHVQRLAALKRPIRIAADFANAMGSVEAQALAGVLQIDPLFEKLDGTFPNHEANPLKAETLGALQSRVRGGRYDFGVAFDGDADRAGFVDEQGAIIPMDLITALIAQSILKETPGADILYDLRSSWAVREVIEESGGRAHICRVGHAFIKQQMRDVNAVFAGEMSGHYYFRANYFTESSAMAVLHIANRLGRTPQPLSELIRPLRRYAKAPEINSEVKDAGAVFGRLREKYGDGKMFELDGLSVEFPDWWFNIRASNTEPLVRLNLEARNQALLDRRLQELLAIIRG